MKIDSEIIVLRLDQLTEFPDNPQKVSSDKMEIITRNMKEKGWYAEFPLVWQCEDKNKYIISGNHRVQCAIAAGIEYQSCIVITDTNYNWEKAKKDVIMYNTLHGEPDETRLKDFVNNIVDEFDCSIEDLSINIGIDEEELADIIMPDLSESEGDDEVQDDVPAITKRGDLWELGKHRVLCGDSTDETNMIKLMNSQYSDMYLSDPPYNVDYEGKTKEKLKIQNDKKNDSEFRLFLNICFGLFFKFLKPGGSFYIWHADSEGYNFRGAIKDNGEEVKQCLIWNKNSMVMGRQDYHWKHEPCLYGWKKGSSHNWYSDRKKTTVIDCQRPSRSLEHPTMKPVELLEMQILNSSKGLDIILDQFLGSGSTLIACEKTNRICYAMELDEHYCDVIVNRYVDWCKKNNVEYSVKLNGEHYSI
jgi:DNA modification methylase